MKSRRLAVLVSGVLLVAFIPLKNLFSTPFSDADSSPGFVPTMYIPPDVDKDGNRIEDVFEEEVQRKIAEGNGTQLARVVVLLNVTPTAVHTSIFVRNNGSMARGIWQHALYGFGGKIPYMLIAKFASVCPSLFLV